MTTASCPRSPPGGAFRGLVDRLNPITLSTNRRQHHAWERKVLDDLRHGDHARAVHAYTMHGRVTTADNLEALREQLVDDWWHTTRTHGPTVGVMIALRVADVDALNQAARRRLAHAGMLTGPKITAADRTFQRGDRVVARRNQRLSTIDGATMQVMNGQRGDVTDVDPTTRAVTVAWDGRTRTVVPARYLDAGHLDHGYAITGHRAQGLTVDQTWIQTGDTLYREWGYVAGSRGRHHNQLYVTGDDVPSNAEELDRGAWQSCDSTAPQRLVTQLGRANAHTAALDQLPSPRPITPAADSMHVTACHLEQGFGID